MCCITSRRQASARRFRARAGRHTSGRWQCERKSHRIFLKDTLTKKRNDLTGGATISSRSRKHSQRSDDTKTEADRILELMFNQGKAQFGNAMKSFWLYDGDLC